MVINFKLWLTAHLLFTAILKCRNRHSHFINRKPKFRENKLTSKDNYWGTGIRTWVYLAPELVVFLLLYFIINSNHFQALFHWKTIQTEEKGVKSIIKVQTMSQNWTGLSESWSNVIRFFYSMTENLNICPLYATLSHL